MAEAQQGAEIANKNCRFVPNVQALPVGTIVIANSDPVMHNTHGFHQKATVFNVALPVKGQRIERPLKKPGSRASSATRTAGCSRGSTSPTTRTTPSRRRTARSASGDAARLLHARRLARVHGGDWSSR